MLELAALAMKAGKFMTLVKEFEALRLSLLLDGNAPQKMQPQMRDFYFRVMSRANTLSTSINGAASLLKNIAGWSSNVGLTNLGQNPNVAKACDIFITGATWSVGDVLDDMKSLRSALETGRIPRQVSGMTNVSLWPSVIGVAAMSAFRRIKGVENVSL